MVDDLTQTWLSFSITPVQRFIEAARTVRDLKTGSEILCWLTDVAIRVGRNQGGRLLFPWIDDAEFNIEGYVRHIPNQFIMLFDKDEQARAAEAACREAVKSTWSTLSGDVRGLFDKAWNDLTWDPGNGWDRQINSFWDLHTAVIPPSDDVLHKHLFGGASEADPRRRQWKVAAAVLAMNKQVRHFPGDQGAGRAKCSMMGDFEQMGPGGTLKQQDTFWKNRKVAAFTRNGIRIGKRDRLCAVALTKRFAPAVENALKWLQDPVPDTASLAVDAWRADVQQRLPQLLGTWDAAAKAYCEGMGEEADSPGRYLLADDLATPKQEEMPGNSTDAQCNAAREEMNQARKQLFDAVKEAKMVPPPRYFAVLALDGDHMGKWLSGDRGIVGDKPLDSGYYHEMSEKLRGYGKTTAQKIVRKYNGFLVYAGGDDLLAFLPVQEVVACARELLDEYPQLPGIKPTTASAGIAICHYLYDLRSALRQARAALEEAKDNGRDRIGWRLLKRSGGDIHGIIERKLVQTFLDATSLFKKGISDRWVYRLAESSAYLHGTAEIQAGWMLCRHALKGVEGSEADKADLKCCAEKLWQAAATNLDDRNTYWNSNACDEDKRCQNGEVNFTGECLRIFVDALLLAIFTIRGRD